MSENTPSELSKRLDDVFGSATNDVVAEKLKEAGHTTSADKVRRYRGGHAERITADFVAAAAKAFRVDLVWLMTGQGGRDGQAGGYTMPNPTPELYAMLADVRKSEPDGLKRVLEIEAISAAIRAEAALVVGRAVEREGAIADRRQQEVRRVSGSTAPVKSVGEPISDAEVAEHGGPLQRPGEADPIAAER